MQISKQPNMYTNIILKKTCALSESRDCCFKEARRTGKAAHLRTGLTLSSM